MSTTVSPLAPKKYPKMPAIDGVRIATAEAGIKYKNRTDLLAMVFDEGTEVGRRLHPLEMPVGAGRFLPRQPGRRQARLLVVNSGNANAFTGKKGRETTAHDRQGRRPRRSAAGRRGLPRLDRRDRRAARRRHASRICWPAWRRTPQPDRWREAAKAIMTTDTYPKVATATVKLGDADVTINGIAKGAGMIAPDMATMLSFVATDAPIAAPVLQALLSERRRQDLQRRHRRQRHLDQRHAAAVRHRRGGQARRAAHRRRRRTRASRPSARRSASVLKIAGAAGGARRRGRAQAGRSHGHRREIGAVGASASRCRSPIRRWSRRRSPARTPIGAASSWPSARPASRPTATACRSGSATSAWRFEGERDPDYSEAATSAYMKREDIRIRADLGLGRGKATVWTCDLTKEYVAINGDYRS